MLNSLFSLNRSFILVTALLIWVPFIVLHDFAIAQETPDDSEMEETLSGFDDEEEFEFSEDSESLSIEESWSSLYGSTGLNFSYSFVKDLPADKTMADWSGLTKVQPYLSLTWDAKLGENWKIRISGKAFYDVAYGM